VEDRDRLRSRHDDVAQSPHHPRDRAPPSSPSSARHRPRRHEIGMRQQIVAWEEGVDLFVGSSPSQIASPEQSDDRSNSASQDDRLRAKQCSPPHEGGLATAQVRDPILCGALQTAAHRPAGTLRDRTARSPRPTAVSTPSVGTARCAARGDSTSSNSGTGSPIRSPRRPSGQFPRLVPTSTPSPIKAAIAGRNHGP
jgi:hypothetical protein